MVDNIVENHNREVPDAQANDYKRALLAQMVQELRGEAGRRVSKAVEASDDWIDEKFSHLTHQQRIVASRNAFIQLIETYVSTVGNETIDAMIQVRGETIEASRKSVVSWLRMIEPLTDRAGADIVPSYRPADLIASLEEIEKEILHNALWAPKRALSTRSRRKFAYDELLAVTVHDQLVDRGFEPAKVRETLKRYYGVDWETMRKWKARASKTLGKDAAELVIAGHGGMLPFKDWPMIESFIYAAGTAYRRQKGDPAVSFYEHAGELKAYLDAAYDGPDQTLHSTMPHPQD